MEIDFDKLWIVRLSNLMPFLIPLLCTLFLWQLRLIRMIEHRFPACNWFMEQLAPFWIIHRAEEIVQSRKDHAHEIKRADLLQLMIDAKLPEEKDKLVRTHVEFHTPLDCFLEGRLHRRDWREAVAFR